MKQKKKSAFTPLESPVPLEKSFLTGFTLLELLIVITLIGILAGIAITRYGPVTESARRAEAYAVLAEIVAAEKRYYLDKDTYIAISSDSGDTNWAELDSFSTAPASDNFTFSVPSIDADSGYALATTKVGGLNYWMCLKNAKKGPGSSPSSCD
jgi:prepilin-type N-terminal cleavage/methylation domain-containing protein